MWKKGQPVEELHQAKVDAASVVGLWIGVLGLVLGVISLAVSLYITYAAERRVFFLVLSGWVAAGLCVSFATYVGYRLVSEIAVFANRCVELARENAVLDKDRDKLATISEYIVSKAVRTAKPRVPRGETPAPDQQSGGDAQ